jgi:hypothetical protein
MCSISSAGQAATFNNDASVRENQRIVASGTSKTLEIVDTIATLRVTLGERGKRLLVMGFSADNDGGQGIFAWNPSFVGPDDGGAHIVPRPKLGEGAWERQFTGALRPEWFGAKCDGVNDDTAAFQAAINYTRTSSKREYLVELSDCTLRFTAPIRITGGLRIVGQGVSPYEGGIGKLGSGSWIFLDHPGVGVNVGSDRVVSGVSFSNFGTRRNQPTPTANWSPGKFDFDFVISNSDALFVDMTLLNPTKGIQLNNGEAGRLTVERLRGQPFQIGIEITKSYDTFRADNVHFWPFWRDDKDVEAYTRSNLDAFHLLRTDNPILSNVFTIFARAGIRFSQNQFGHLNKLHLSNSDFDRGNFGLWIDASVTEGITGQVDNVTIEGESKMPGTKGFFNQGNKSRLSFGNLRIDVSDQNAFRVDGMANDIRIGNLEIIGYDQSKSGFPAVEAAPGNSIHIAQIPYIANGGAGAIFGGRGAIGVGMVGDIKK